MKKTEVLKMLAKQGLISNSIIIAERSTGKLNAAIDCFSRELKVIALDDGIKIDAIYDPRMQILKIRSDYEEFEVFANVSSYLLLNNMPNMNKFAHYVYDIIKQNFIEYFECCENNKETDYDEHWEFVDIGSM